MPAAGDHREGYRPAASTLTGAPADFAARAHACFGHLDPTRPNSADRSTLPDCSSPKYGWPSKSDPKELSDSAGMTCVVGRCWVRTKSITSETTARPRSFRILRISVFPVLSVSSCAHARFSLGLAQATAVPRVRPTGRGSRVRDPEHGSGRRDAGVPSRPASTP